MHHRFTFSVVPTGTNIYYDIFADISRNNVNLLDSESNYSIYMLGICVEDTQVTWNLPLGTVWTFEKLEIVHCVRDIFILKETMCVLNWN